MISLNDAKEFEFLYRTIKKYRRENKPCQDYVTQITEVMAKMEKEDRPLATGFFNSIRDKVDSEFDQSNQNS